MEKCKCCGMIVKTTKNINKLEEIPEQENVKRAIEVCLVGSHTIGIININGCGEEFAEWLRTQHISVWVEARCPCGNYGDVYAECKCLMTKISQWTKRKGYIQCLNSDIVIESVRLRGYALIKSYYSESQEQMFKRIEQAKKINIVDTKLDEQSNGLLKFAIERLGIGHKKVEPIKAVAISIAKLDGMDKIEVQHISEAIQYNYFNQ